MFVHVALPIRFDESYCYKRYSTVLNCLHDGGEPSVMIIVSCLVMEQQDKAIHRRNVDSLWANYSRIQIP